MGKLLVIATPIGNLEDLTLRALRELNSLDALACEDTRHTSILLKRHEITRPPRVFSYHEHNERQATKGILNLLNQGLKVGLVSDAGSPGISDPGYLAIRAAIDGGHEIEVLPGPSATITALLASGLPNSSFTFLGFPPRKTGKRCHFLEAEMNSPHTLIMYEAPGRLLGLLEDARKTLGNRHAAVCLELTKMFETVTRDNLDGLIDFFKNEVPRGEIVVVIAGKNKKFIDNDDGEVDEKLKESQNHDSFIHEFCDEDEEECLIDSPNNDPCAEEVDESGVTDEADEKESF